MTDSYVCIRVVDDDVEQEDEGHLLPALEVGQVLDCKEIVAMERLLSSSTLYRS